MEPLLFAFIATLAAEWGDKTQLFVASLSTGRRPLPVIAGVAIGAALASGIAAVAGAQLHGLLAPRALALLVAVGFAYAGVTALMRPSVPTRGPLRHGGPVLTTALAVLLLELGDKTQLNAAALSARYGEPWLVAIGATAGVTLVTLPALLIGQTGGTVVRRLAAVLFLVSAAGVALTA